MKKLKNPTETEIVVAPNVCHVFVHVNIAMQDISNDAFLSFHSTSFHHLDLVVWMDFFFSSFVLSSVSVARNFFSASALALRFCYILVLLLAVIYCTHGLGCCCCWFFWSVSPLYLPFALSLCRCVSLQTLPSASRILISSAYDFHFSDEKNAQQFSGRTERNPSFGDVLASFSVLWPAAAASSSVRLN